ncbi:branched-chain amino acid ABC transporter permease [Ancylobacter sonchi]|uniref:branched-chain amino acid ABC transporter permease n=1 Tax=Ancylobacter sonchi TaxID=1937790 RepID=UPI001BD4F78F|nr:branched-chain amino acid ABC transporter permease [Ancylobacter sonchi]MBS7533223.1 branched-chain amino acid ABC transporter permease [Ancylobacter sonchi]
MQVLIDAASTGSLYALVALAIGLVFGVMRLINFVQGDYITIGAYALIVPSAAATPTLFIGLWPVPLAIGGIMLIVVLVALATERAAFRPLRQTDPSTLLISSFALSFLFQQTMMLVYNSRPKSVDFGSSLAAAVAIGDLRVPGIQLVTMATAAICGLALILFLRRTSLGIEMRAAAEDFGMAQLLGVRANRVIALAFAISGALGAVSALLIVVQTGTLDYRMGVMPVIYGFFATVIGGMGSLAGAALGGFLVGAASQLLQAWLPGDLRPFRDAFVFGLVILVLLVRPEGIARSRAARERV